MNTSSRYLTPDEKATILETWTWAQQTLRDGCPGGPDPAMVGWCARLNALAGLCTLQSCGGHRAPDGSIARPGHLWLWLDAALSARFDVEAFTLAQQPHLERVARLYTSWGQEVTVLEFAGNERNCLPVAMAGILAFFQTLARQSTSSEEVPLEKRYL